MATLRWDQRNGVAGASSLVVLLLCGLPFVWLFATIDLTGLGQPDTWATSLFVESTLLALAATLTGVVLGAGAALALDRLPYSLRPLLLLILALPLLLPSYLHALAWSELLANFAGPLNASQSPMRGDTGTAIWVLAISYSPVATLCVAAALQRWDKRYEWAAWTHRRTPMAVLTLKARYLAAPTMMAALIIFLLVFSDFAVADYFQVRTFSTEVFVQVSSYLDLSAAGLLSLPFLVLTLAAVAMLIRSLTQVPQTTGAFVPADRQRRIAITPRVVAGALSVLFVLLAVCPFIILTTQIGGVEPFFAAFEMIWPDALMGGGIAAACALFAVVLSVLAAWGCDRSLRPAGIWLRTLPALAFALPASLLGLAFIGLWNRPYFAAWIYDSGLALVLAIAVRWLFVPFEVLAQAWRRVSKQEEEAGLTSGRAWMPVFRGILLRPMLPAIGVAFFLTFILAFNELTLVTLLAPPGVSTLPLRVFQTVHYGPQSLLAAICIWQAVFLIVPVSLLLLSLRYLRRPLEVR